MKLLFMFCVCSIIYLSFMWLPLKHSFNNIVVISYLMLPFRKGDNDSLVSQW
uniref:Uncharacterized protein n=1 Tax=Arundo donax TaxID=35708 RepID=A0A0A9C974_ARUDO